MKNVIEWDRAKERVKKQFFQDAKIKKWRTKKVKEPELISSLSTQSEHLIELLDERFETSVILRSEVLERVKKAIHNLTPDE